MQSRLIDPGKAGAYRALIHKWTAAGFKVPQGKITVHTWLVEARTVAL